MKKQNLGKLSIDEIEKLLDKDDEIEISILPNGEIVSSDEVDKTKILTFRENLGGEYSNEKKKIL
jgi:hypothetical protein